jgi:hypothetical protein
MLAIWTVYDHPIDYPTKFVARRFEIDRGGHRPTPDIIVAPNLKKLRAVLEFELHLTCVPRNPSDERHILEVWI